MEEQEAARREEESVLEKENVASNKETDGSKAKRKSSYKNETQKNRYFTALKVIRSVLLISFRPLSTKKQE